MEQETFESTLTTDEIIESALSSTDRPFLSTPLDEYTVTEGLLLIIVFLLVIGWLWKQIKEVF